MKSAYKGIWEDFLTFHMLMSAGLGLGEQYPALSRGTGQQALF